MGAAHGGQVLVSLATAELVRDGALDGIEFVELGEFRLRGLSRLERVFQLVAPGLVREFPPFPESRADHSSLPLQVTSFVGRDAEVAGTLDALLRSRVVTLTGVGGVGKTRLAVEVAAQAAPGFRDGTWVWELATARDPELLPELALTVFRLQPRAGFAASDILSEFLRSKELLWVLDNCEHLLRPVAQLVEEIVRTCPGVRVLATSREGLSVGGEQILVVPSFDTPGPDADLEEIAGSEAVRLFVDRARAVKVGFVLDEHSAGPVARVCRRLDGIALAIELAAARVAVLSPDEIARRVDQRFQLLAGGRRGVVERHQTLRAAIDWSYDLLGDAEQRLLDAVSVFNGGFSLDAAEAVATANELERDEVFEVLASLVSRSLVIANTDEVDTRYRLFETIRDYAEEHLDRGPSPDRVHTQHASYFASFAEQAMSRRLDDELWEHRLEAELPNLWSALTWAVDSHNLDTVLRLASLWNTTVMTASDYAINTVLAPIAESALAIHGATEHPRYPAALVGSAHHALSRGDPRLAHRRCDEAEHAEARLGTEPSASLRLIRAMIATVEGNLDESLRHTTQAIDLARAHGDPGLAVILALHASTLVRAGNSIDAEPYADEAVTLARRIGNPKLRESALGVAAYALGDTQPQRALELAWEALEPSLATGTRTPAWAFAADLAARLGNSHDALTLFAHAIDDWNWFGAQPVVGAMLGRVADLLTTDNPEAAVVLHAASATHAPDFVQAPHVLEARAQAHDAEAAALDLTRRQQLCAEGEAMDLDAAIAYAHTAIDRVVAA
jgi:predicted ATPase